MLHFEGILPEALQEYMHWYCYAQAWNLCEEGNAFDFVDKSLRGAFSKEEALRCIQVGLLCTQYGSHHRPNMISVVKMLLGLDPSLQEKVVEAALYKPNLKSDAIFNLENAYLKPSS